MRGISSKQNLDFIKCQNINQITGVKRRKPKETSLDKKKIWLKIGKKKKKRIK